MTKTTNQRRTAASVVENIRKRLEAEQLILIDAEREVLINQARVNVTQQILDDAEKNGSDDD